jgi:hypothetical protein
MGEDAFLLFLERCFNPSTWIFEAFVCLEEKGNLGLFTLKQLSKNQCLLANNVFMNVILYKPILFVE